MKKFWDQRYARKEFVYGKEPNRFFADELAKLDPGTILMPAEGEGRNAVFAATLGWKVEAFDISAEGKRKAEELAALNGVAINYQVSSLQEVRFEDYYFDAIGLVFAHFPSSIKSTFLIQLQQYLKPGGKVILEAFSKNQLAFSKVNPKAGGPKDLDLLYSVEEVSMIFSGFETEQISEIEVELEEGDFHVGKSSVIRFVGVKQ